MALTLDDKPWWVGLVIGLVLAVACLGGVEYLVVGGIKEQIRAAESQREELDKKIEQGRAAERKLPQFREEVKRLELELEKLRRILPSTRNTEEIIKKIKSLVDQGEFALRRLSFPKLGDRGKDGDPYAEWPVTVQVEGRYHDLAILFNRLGNFSRIMNVENIEVSALNPQLERTVSSSFVAKTFVYIEAEGDEEEAKAPAGAKPGGGGGGGEE